jgi:hypothetical protein
VRIGAYDLNQGGSGTLYVSRPMVLIGDTAADGSRPTIVGNSGDDGVYLDGPGSVEIHNVDVSGFWTAFVVAGPSCALFRGVRVHDVTHGVYVAMPAGCVRIERSRLIGPGPQGEGYAGRGVVAVAVVDTLTIEDTEIADFAYGVHDGSMQIDSLTIRRSLLHDAGTSAVWVSSYCYSCVAPEPGASRPAGRAPRSGVAAPPQRGPQDGAPTSQAVVIEASRLARSGSYLVEIYTQLRRAVFTHSAFSNPAGNVLNVKSTGGGGHLSMTGDSIVAPPNQQHYGWLDARDLDSLDIDSLVAAGFQVGNVYSTPLIRVSNSTFRDVRGIGMQVVPSYSTGAVLRFDNVGIYGDPRDDIVAVGFLASGVRVTMDRFTGVNLREGVNTRYSDSSTTVTNSLFQHVQYPISWYTAGSVAPDSVGLTVQNTTFRGFYLGIEGNDGTLVVDSNTFVNGSLAIYAHGAKPMTVTRNQISGVESGVELLNIDSTALITVADNSISGVTVKGLYAQSGAYYPDTIQTVLDVRRNTVACVGVGATSAVGIELRTADIVVQDNQVDGCFAGLVATNHGNRLRTESIVGNTVSVPASGQVGIGVSGIVSARITRNTVSGAATGQQYYGLIDVADCPSYGGCPDANVPTAIIDSNRVTGGTVWGIHAQWVDSLEIVANRVDSLHLPSGAYTGYSENYGAISINGSLSTFGRIAGNVIRHIAGNGIFVGHNGTTVSVDSNVVADIDSSGLVYQFGYSYNGGPVAITRNLFTGARREALRINWDCTASATGNNIAGNVYGARDVGWECHFGALNNWWGDSRGPRCIGCDASSTGDSVSDYVNWLPASTVPNGSAPLLPVPAPRLLAQVRAAPLARAAIATGPYDAPIAGGERLHLPKARPARPASMSRPVAGTGPLADRRAAEARDQAALEARRAARLQQLRDRAEARVRAEELLRVRRTSSPRAQRSQGVRP